MCAGALGANVALSCWYFSFIFAKLRSFKRRSILYLYIKFFLNCWSGFIGNHILVKFVKFSNTANVSKLVGLKNLLTIIGSFVPNVNSESSKDIELEVK